MFNFYSLAGPEHNIRNPTSGGIGFLSVYSFENYQQSARVKSSRYVGNPEIEVGGRKIEVRAKAVKDSCT